MRKLRFGMPKGRYALGLAVMALAFGAFLWLFPAQTAAAACTDNGRACNYGYFFNQGPYSTGHNMFTPPTEGLYANSIWDLFGGIGGKMLCQNAGQPGSKFGVPETDQNASSAAFIVLTMLGAPPGTPKSKACERWNEWTDLVGAYDAAGLIHYNEMHDFDCINTAYTSVTNDDFYYAQCGAAASIVFYGQNGQPLYAIKRDCGNPVGRLQALTSLKKPPTGDVNLPKQNPPGDTTPPGFNTGDSTVNSSCAVISGHAFDPNQPAKGVPVKVTYSIGGTSTGTASTSGSHLFTINTPSNVRNSTGPVTVTVVGTDSSNTQFQLANSPITIGPCLMANPVCDGFNTTPAAIDPGTGYTLTAKVRYGNAAEAAAVMARPDTKFFVTINGPGVSTNISSVTPISSDGTGGLSVTTQPQPPTGQTGSYVVGWGITGSFGAIPCGGAIPGNTSPPTFPVNGKPYFQADGDVSAGSGMSTGGVDCAVGTNSKAGIVSWNRGAANGYAGAGTRYGATATNFLQDFVSGQGSPYSPSGLSFANDSSAQVDAGAGLFGGKFKAPECIADYFAKAMNVQDGDVTIGGQLVKNGTHQTIYVNGNVYITGPVTFSGSYASPADIPSFSVVVKGNIYVAPGVGQLDGFYIAQPSSGTATDGNIYTCAPTAFVAPALDKGLSGACNKPLVVNGSFTARQIWLLRTSGSVTSTPAETFNYSPELWLSAPFGNGLGGGMIGSYDSITGLPPTL